MTIKNKSRARNFKHFPSLEVSNSTLSSPLSLSVDISIDRMGGSMIEDDWDFSSLSNGARTIVLVGRTGNGKSATGNSILGRKAYKSRASSAGVTSTSELQATMLKDGQIINVIDTPGLFDLSVGSEVIGKEIVKCIDLAKDGIHAILLVYSVRTRFSKEEEAALKSLQNFFGPKITDYIIVVFTGGDELEDDDETLEDYLGRECPEPLKQILEAAKNRCVLFDNKSKDPAKKDEQLQKLLNLVDLVVEENGGKPYTDDVFKELKRGAMKLQRQEKDFDSLKGYEKGEILALKEQVQNAYDDQLKKITEMVEIKLKETTERLEQQLAQEQAARLRAEELALTAQAKSNDEIRKLRENLERAKKETDELRKQAESGKCTIL